eukprot:3223939-Rhodomonas_salina.1
MGPLREIVGGLHREFGPNCANAVRIHVLDRGATPSFGFGLPRAVSAHACANGETRLVCEGTSRDARMGLGFRPWDRGGSGWGERDLGGDERR